MLVGLGLIATVVGIVAFVRYRERETATLRRDAGLAADLRTLAGDDAVRRAAVDEFELAIYQRLFYASVVGPRVRSAAWAALGAVLATTAALVTRGDNGLAVAVVQICAWVLAAGFTVAALAFAALAVFHTAATPRVSFTESYAESDSGDGAVETEDTAVAVDGTADDAESADREANGRR